MEKQLTIKQTVVTLIVLVLLFVIIALMPRAVFAANKTIVSSTNNSLFPWTEPQNHHKAVVQITTIGPYNSTSSASGVCICPHINSTGEKAGLILTAAHVVRNAHATYARFQSSSSPGYKSRVRIVGIDNRADLALLRSFVPEDAVYIPISAFDPAKGQVVEHCGYLNGKTQWLGHYKAMVTDKWGDMLTCDSYVTHGYSGGAVVYKSQFGPGIVGIISGGTNTYRADGFVLYRPTVSADRRTIINFWNRLAAEKSFNTSSSRTSNTVTGLHQIPCQSCPGGMCPQYGGYSPYQQQMPFQQQQQIRSPIQSRVIPPAPIQKQLPIQVPVQPQIIVEEERARVGKQQIAFDFDYDVLIDELKRDKDFLDLIRGRDGKDGRDGEDSDFRIKVEVFKDGALVDESVLSE